MSALVLSALRTARELIATPARWVQGHWMAHRDARGNVWKLNGRALGNCLCASQAITQALVMHGALTAENRSECERVVLEVAEKATWRTWPALYQLNDDSGTSHRAMLGWFDGAIAGLEAA